MDQSRIPVRKPLPPQPQPATAPTPVQSQKKPKNRKKRSATTSSVVLSLVSAIIGGVITAGASIWVASMTAQAQQTQSIEEYRRTNREKIYQDMLTQMTAMDNAVDF